MVMVIYFQRFDFDYFRDFQSNLLIIQLHAANLERAPKFHQFISIGLIGHCLLFLDS